MEMNEAQKALKATLFSHHFGGDFILNNEENGVAQQSRLKSVTDDFTCRVGGGGKSRERSLLLLGKKQ